MSNIEICLMSLWRTKHFHIFRKKIYIYVSYIFQYLPLPLPLQMEFLGTKQINIQQQPVIIQFLLKLD